MITLKTLDQATAQEVFDQVANHLLNQRKKSINLSEGCLYKSPEGLKCAAGCLISDDEYSSDMEHKTWVSLVEEKAIPTTKHEDLIADLQWIHDFTNPEYWPAKLKRVAEKHKLGWY